MSILKTLIVIVVVIVTVYGYDNNFSENDLNVLQKALNESAIYMRNEVKHEDVSICIGATRAGKSTLINYLIGNKLKSVRHSRFHPITIERIDNEFLGPEIGRGTTSKTTIPTKWVSKVYTNLIIWDAPGFDDNRGAVQDITNAFYLYQLVQNVNSLKIVLVVDINDILHDNIKPFISLLTAVESLLGEKMTDFYSSISVVFTKVPNTLEGVPVNMEFINIKLTNQFLSTGDMELSHRSKEFIQNLIRSNKQIALFKRPETEGDINPAVDVNIFQAINNSLSIPKDSLQQLRPSISESSTLRLYSIREKLYSKSAFDELQNNINYLVEKRITDAGNLTNAEDAKNKLTTLMEKLTIMENTLINVSYFAKDFYKQMEILQTMHLRIEQTIQANNLLDTIKLMVFVDKLLNLNESQILYKKMEVVLANSLLKVRETVNLVREKLNELIQREHDEKIRQEQEANQKHLNELKNEIKKKEENNNQLLLLGGAALLLYLG